MPLDGIKCICDNCACAVSIEDAYGISEEAARLDKKYIVCGNGPLMSTIQYRLFGCDYWKGKENKQNVNGKFGDWK